MAYTNKIINLWTLKVNKVVSSDDCIMPQTQCCTYTFIARNSGIVRIFLHGGYLNPNLANFYLTTDFEFDPINGRPVNYSQMSSRVSIFDINVVQGTRYYVLMRGYDNVIDSYCTIEYTSVTDYVLERTNVNLNDFYGNKQILSGCHDGYTTTVFTITPKYTGNIIIRASLNDYEASQFAITTSYLPIRADTGLPETDIGSGYIFYKYFHCTAGTTYYVYCKKSYFYDSGRAVVVRVFFQDDEIVDGIRGKYYFSFVDGVVKDQFDRVQGTVYGYAISQHEDIPGGGGGSRGVMIMWDPSGGTGMNMTYDGRTYKSWDFDYWSTKSGVYISDSPFVQCGDITGLDYRTDNVMNTLHVEGHITLKTTDFNWTNPKTSKGPFNITADEWNNFIHYAEYKCNQEVSGIIPTLDRATYRQVYSWSPLTFAYKDDRIYATQFNNLKSMLDSKTTSLDPTTPVATGDIIYASYINNLLTEARSI